MRHTSFHSRMIALALVAITIAALLLGASGMALAAQRPVPASTSSPDSLAWLWQALARFVGEPLRGGLADEVCGGGTSGGSQSPPVPSPNAGITIDPNG
jgi:hypothetical protein